MATESPLLLAVSLLSHCPLSGYLARQVGKSRIAHKIMPPIVTGPMTPKETFGGGLMCWSARLYTAGDNGGDCNNGPAAKLRQKWQTFDLIALASE
uniref:Secreted protein n=1 Tax=Myripristis murdjan TaxID=586833 RepID=A0A667YQY7_9TELE